MVDTVRWRTLQTDIRVHHARSPPGQSRRSEGTVLWQRDVRESHQDKGLKARLLKCLQWSQFLHYLLARWVQLFQHLFWNSWAPAKWVCATLVWTLHVVQITTRGGIWYIGSWQFWLLTYAAFCLPPFFFFKWAQNWHRETTVWKGTEADLTEWFAFTLEMCF